MLATHAVIIFSVRIFTNRAIIDSNPEPSLSIVIQATMAQSPPSKHNLILLILLSGILTACQVSSRTGRQESEPTPEMATPPALQEEFLLLAPLYYLQAGQIWRLDSNAQSPQQPVQPNQHYTVGLQGYHASNAKANLDVTMDELTELGRGRVVATCVQDLVLEYLREHQNFREDIEDRLLYIPSSSI